MKMEGVNAIFTKLMDAFGLISREQRFKQDGVAIFNIEDSGKKYQIAIYDTERFQLDNVGAPPMQWNK